MVLLESNLLTSLQFLDYLITIQLRILDRKSLSWKVHQILLCQIASEYSAVATRIVAT